MHLDATEQYQVNTNCESSTSIVNKKWFILPPVMQFYYKNSHVNYKVVPPFRADCQVMQQGGTMDFIYPKTNSKIYLTKNFNSTVQPAIFKVACSNKNAKLFWYIDRQFKGTTQNFHEMQISAETGYHYITVVDETGNEISRKIEISN